MPLTQVSWVWVWIPTKSYERANLRVPELQLRPTSTSADLFGEDPPMEDLVEEVLKTLIVERKTEQYSQDENFKLIQFCIKDEVGAHDFKTSL